MQSADRLYLQLYTFSILFWNGVLIPIEAFKGMSTGEQDIDDFFAQFWEKARDQATFEEKMIAECGALTERHPYFALVQHVIGIYLYLDTNAFHLGLRNICVQYALMRLVQAGGALNEPATRFLAEYSFAAFKDVSMSNGAYELLRAASPLLVPESNEQNPYLSESENIRPLFPEMPVTEHTLDLPLRDKIDKVIFETGASISTYAITQEIGWYKSLLEHFSS